MEGYNDIKKIAESPYKMINNDTQDLQLNKTNNWSERIRNSSRKMSNNDFISH